MEVSRSSGYRFHLSFYYPRGNAELEDFVYSVELPLLSFGMTDTDILESSLRDLQVLAKVIRERVKTENS